MAMNVVDKFIYSSATEIVHKNVSVQRFPLTLALNQSDLSWSLCVLLSKGKVVNYFALNKKVHLDNTRGPNPIYT